jgi:predicted amidohydrolase YtcJ
MLGNSCNRPPSAPAADLIVTHGKIWTVDESLPEAEAVAIIGERIVAVGSSAEIEAWRGESTQVIDAGGRRVLPGFNDAHVHFVQAGAQLDNVQLKDAATPEEFARRIAERAQSIPDGEWILGGDWDEQLWDPAELPTKELIDAATPSNPVFVIRYDGHMALVNSLTLELAGIGPDTPDPPAGTIFRDDQGNPTGVLKIAAMDLVEEVVPPTTREMRLRATKRALEYAASLGVTSVQDMTTNNEDTAVFAELATRGELTCRIYVAPAEAQWQEQATLGIQGAFGSSYLRLGAVKSFIDGSLGSSTALFFEPYTDDPSNSGTLRQESIPFADAQERFTLADKAGLQLCLHAVGDKGNSITLDALEHIVSVNGDRDRRFRIEHAQHLRPEDFQRFADLDVIASIQPYHAIDDGRWAEARIGPERSKTTYAFRTLLNHNVRLAVGTDWNGAPFEPMLTLYAAVTRATLDGEHPDGWIPEEKLTLEETIEGYTMGAAYAEFQENEKGSITRGKLADLVILGRDVFEIPVEEIPDVQVETTIVGGKVVFQR